jgi:hypothetical protein
MTESLFYAGGGSFDETVEAASDAVDGSELPSNVRRMGDEDPPTSLEDVVAIELVEWPGVLDCLCVSMLLLFLLGLFLFLFLPMVSMRRCRVIMQCRICRCYSVVQ